VWIENMSANVEQIAGLCHEINRIYCESIGDTSQPLWADAPDWQVTSARNGVLFVLQNPDSTPSDQHDSWMAEKLSDGWTLHAKKDVINKTHPCLVPYEHLPRVQQTKDSLFRACVIAMRTT
jgi:hypothetical protein